jgi:glucokinase
MKILLADIGGTYCRLAIADQGNVTPVWSAGVSAVATPIAAIKAFLEATAFHGALDGAVIAAAGPVQEGRSRLTNAAWIIDESEIAHAFGIPWVRVVNDLEAVAAGLPDLAPADSRLIGPDTPLPGAPLAIVAPGTGLGVAALLLAPGGRCVVPSEGGHMSLAAFDDDSAGVIHWLHHRFGHVSAERVLSGAGLVNLYQAIAARDGVVADMRLPRDITAGAFNGTCPTCLAAVDLFCSFLGAFAGDVALTFGARGGVFIGGGIVPRFVDHLVRSDFRGRFQAKGRLRPFLERVPTRVIVYPSPAFIGLSSIARNVADSRRPSATRRQRNHG